MKKQNNKKKLIIVSAISLFTILGGTLAYFSTTSDLENVFRSGKYQNEIVENFESPTSWTPGTTTTKEVTVKNKGNVDMAVRASYTEKWISADGNELPLKDNDNNSAAIINFNDGWEKASDGYYYYGSKSNLTRLRSGETSSSFINSVTFNENIKATLNADVSPDGHSITYTSSGYGYDNATYKLTIKIDTIQYDQANNIW